MGVVLGALGIDENLRKIGKIVVVVVGSLVAVVVGPVELVVVERQLVVVVQLVELELVPRFVVGLVELVVVVQRVELEVVPRFDVEQVGLGSVVVGLVEVERKRGLGFVRLEVVVVEVVAS